MRGAEVPRVGYGGRGCPLGNWVTMQRDGESSLALVVSWSEEDPG